ncbi:MAG: thioredoxin fold domain-containing protein [Bacteroidetes bacterium]|nr:thioredoxin fold domain-containing protein [Bacteroidota bacterium]
MKKNFLFLSILTGILLYSCSQSQATGSGGELNVTDFAAKVKQLPDAPILDVRTPGEYEKGHLDKAKNIDWNGSDFDTQITGLDKSKPVLVYCLSGGRSGAAAAHMREAGFKEVYEMAGGIMKWRAADLPLVTGNAPAKATGMTQEQFAAMVKSDKLVLVDFYADWCAPCQKMKPYLMEIKDDMKDKVEVVRINADDNQTLCKDLKIDALPVLQLYRAGQLTWTNQGYISKEEVVKKLQ